MLKLLAAHSKQSRTPPGALQAHHPSSVAANGKNRDRMSHRLPGVRHSLLDEQRYSWIRRLIMVALKDRTACYSHVPLYQVLGFAMELVRSRLVCAQDRQLLSCTGSRLQAVWAGQPATAQGVGEGVLGHLQEACWDAALICEFALDSPTGG